AVERSSFALYDPNREMDSVFSCHIAQEVRLAAGNRDRGLQVSPKRFTSICTAPSNVSAELTSFRISTDECLRKDDQGGTAGPGFRRQRLNLRQGAFEI